MGILGPTTKADYPGATIAGFPAVTPLPISDWAPVANAGQLDAITDLPNATADLPDVLDASADPVERPQRPTVCEILRKYGPAYLDLYGHTLSKHERRTLEELSLCRTAALGGHYWECNGCGGGLVSYNSCHNRHCPGCGDTRREAWLDKMLDAVLPVPYWHVVFTVPHHLNPLIEAN